VPAGGTLTGIPVQKQVRASSLNLEEAEKELLVAAMVEHQGSIPDVADALGVSRGTVYNKLRKFGIDPAVYRGS